MPRGALARCRRHGAWVFEILGLRVYFARCGKSFVSGAAVYSDAGHVKRGGAVRDTVEGVVGRGALGVGDCEVWLHRT